MIEGSCDCGAIRFALTSKPQGLTDCNCSLCIRYGALWAHMAADQASITYDPGAVIRYRRDEKYIDFVTCKTCGCTSHWEAAGDEADGKIAVNMRLVDDKDRGDIPVHRFDGADTWTYLD